jgi:hypothetical protein
MDEPGLTSVKVAGARFRRAQNEHDDAQAALAEAAGAALAEGVPTSRVAQAARVTPQTLHAVLNR